MEATQTKLHVRLCKPWAAGKESCLLLFAGMQVWRAGLDGQCSAWAHFSERATWRHILWLHTSYIRNKHENI